MKNAHDLTHRKYISKILLFLFILALCSTIYVFGVLAPFNRSKHPSSYVHESYVFENEEYQMEVSVPFDAVAYLIVSLQNDESACEILLHLNLSDLENQTDISAHAYSIDTNSYLGMIYVHMDQHTMQFVIDETFGDSATLEENTVLGALKGDTVVLTAKKQTERTRKHL